MLYVRKLQSVTLAVLLFWVGAAEAQQNWQSGGWVLDVNGPALAAGMRVRPGSIMAPEATLALEEKAAATLFLPASQEKVVITGPGNFKVYPNRVVIIKGSKTSVTASRPQARFPRLDLKTEKTLAGVVLRSAKSVAPGDAQALVPDGEKVLAAGVRFSWPKQKRRGEYQLRLYDESGYEIFEAKQDKEGLKLPDSYHLEKGAKYLWELAWQSPGGTKMLKTGRFRTLNEDEESFLHARPVRGKATEADRRLYAMWLGAIGADSLMRHALAKLPEVK